MSQTGLLAKNIQGCQIDPHTQTRKPADDPSSYRPISLLSSLGKLLEKLFTAKLTKLCEEKNIIHDAQFGFRPEHSTTHQLRRVVKQIKDAKRKRKSTGAVFLDIEKAFDAVWHNGLLHKVSCMKFPLYMIKLLQSFLRNRRFAVCAEGEMSEWRQLQAGLPQGSPLSPILYTIFTADLIVPENCSVALYADDTALLASAKSSNVIIKRLERALTNIQTYYDDWKIKINTHKTQAVLFPYNRSYRRKPTAKLIQGGNEIVLSRSATYLGVILDQKLRFAEHIEQTRKKAYRKLATVYPLLTNKHLATKSKTLIYTAILRPTVTYASPVCHEAAAYHLNCLQVFQNKCLKTVFGLNRRFPTRQIQRSTGVQPIRTHIASEVRHFYWRCHNAEKSIIRDLAN